MMPDVPSFRRKVRPLRSTSATATSVITTLTILKPRSAQFANAPWKPASWKIFTE